MRVTSPLAPCEPVSNSDGSAPLSRKADWQAFWYACGSKVRGSIMYAAREEHFALDVPTTL
eukprot:4649468-Pyramimonas_sp.AAC.1